MENNLNSIYKQKYIKYKNKYNVLKGESIPITDPSQLLLIGGSGFEGRPGRHNREASNKKLNLLSIHFIPKLKILVKHKMAEFTETKGIDPQSTIPNPAEMLIKLADILFFIVNINPKRQDYYKFSHTITVPANLEVKSVIAFFDGPLLALFKDYNIELLPDGQYKYTNILTGGDLGKFKEQIANLKGLANILLSTYEMSSQPIPECPYSKAEELKEYLSVKKKENINNFYLLAGHGEEDSGFEIIGDTIIPKQPSLIRLDGYYKFVRISSYGEAVQNGWGDFFYCLFSQKSEHITEVINYLANINNKKWTQVAIAAYTTILEELLIKLNIQIFEYFLPKFTKPEDLDEEIINKITKRLMGWTNKEEIRTLLQYIIEYKMTGQIDYLEQWCRLKIIEMLNKITITDTLISDMNLKFDLEILGSKAGVFSRNDLMSISHEDKIETVCGFNASAGLFSTEFGKISEIKLSHLINSGRYLDGNFTVAGLPPGTYFLATCRIERSLVDNIIQPDHTGLVYKKILSHLQDESELVKQDKKQTELLEKISTILKTQGKDHLIGKAPIISDIYNRIPIEDETERLEKAIDMFLEFEASVADDPELRTQLIERKTKGLEHLKALRATSMERQEKIGIATDLSDDELYSYVDDEIGRYNSILHKFNGKEYKIININPFKMTVRYNYLALLSTITKEELNAFYLKFKQPDECKGFCFSKFLASPNVKNLKKVSYDKFITIVKKNVSQSTADKLYIFLCFSFSALVADYLEQNGISDDSIKLTLVDRNMEFNVPIEVIDNVNLLLRNSVN